MKIIWKKNGGPVIPRAQIGTRVNDISTLFIAEVVEDDSGEYSCEAHNTPGIMADSTVNISIITRGKLTSSVL